MNLQFFGGRGSAGGNAKESAVTAANTTKVVANAQFSTSAGVYDQKF